MIGNSRLGSRVRTGRIARKFAITALLQFALFACVADAAPAQGFCIFCEASKADDAGQSKTNPASETTVGTAPSKPGPSKSPGLSRDIACESEETLANCPKACKDFCSKPDFFTRHSEACNGAVAKAGIKADAGVCATYRVVENRLEKCLTKAASMPGYDQTIKLYERSPPIHDSMKKLFEGFPGCVPSTQALVAKFDCLKQEGESLKSSAEALSSQGYDPDKEDRDRICKLSPEQVVNDSLEAQALANRSKQLLDEFGTTSHCGQDVNTWMGSRPNGGTGPIAAQIDRAIANLKDALGPASKTELEVKKLAPQLGAQIEKMSAVIIGATLSCAASK